MELSSVQKMSSLSLPNIELILSLFVINSVQLLEVCYICTQYEGYTVVKELSKLCKQPITEYALNRNKSFV